MKGQHFKDVHIISSRKPAKVVRVSADWEVSEIDALRAVSDRLPAPEPGESVSLKVYFGEGK